MTLDVLPVDNARCDTDTVDDDDDDGVVIMDDNLGSKPMHNTWQCSASFITRMVYQCMHEWVTLGK